MTDMSQRKAAKVLGVDKRTIARDVGQSAPKSGAKSATGKAPAGATRALLDDAPPPGPGDYRDDDGTDAGVSHAIINRDVGNKVSKSANKVSTGSAAALGRWLT
jgi:hypothetical protein